MRVYTEDRSWIHTHAVYVGRSADRVSGSAHFSTSRAAAVSFGWDPSGTEPYVVTRIVLHKGTQETVVVYPDLEV